VLRLEVAAAAGLDFRLSRFSDMSFAARNFRGSVVETFFARNFSTEPLPAERGALHMQKVT